ncbi:MAG: TIGR00366 family protein, partial [Bacteroidales bacterium]|nr:TIGR00366 family protein [Bacteroidales bacterium]
MCEDGEPLVARPVHLCHHADIDCGRCGHAGVPPDPCRGDCQLGRRHHGTAEVCHADGLGVGLWIDAGFGTVGEAWHRASGLDTQDTSCSHRVGDSRQRTLLLAQLGLCLIVGVIFAKEIARQLAGVDYRLLIASA